MWVVAVLAALIIITSIRDRRAARQRDELWNEAFGEPEPNLVAQ